jgi:hypothetical protein
MITALSIVFFVSTIVGVYPHIADLFAGVHGLIRAGRAKWASGTRIEITPTAVMDSLLDTPEFSERPLSHCSTGLRRTATE